jgi:hypothetical protein
MSAEYPDHARRAWFVGSWGNGGGVQVVSLVGTKERAAMSESEPIFAPGAAG